MVGTVGMLGMVDETVGVVGSVDGASPEPG